MIIECFGTGSTGNSYLAYFKDETKPILLDFGIDLNGKQRINDIEFGFLSHTHIDHNKFFNKYAFKGLKTIQGETIQDFTEISLEWLKSINYQVFCFPLEHNGKENSGIIIKNIKTGECLLYATDFSICKYDLSQFKITNILVECNFLDVLIRYKSDFKSRNQKKAHMSLEGLKIFMDKLNLDYCNEIILCHISSSYGDKNLFLKQIAERYGKKTGICKTRGGIEWYGGN